MTENQRKRTLDALTETCEALEKAMRYQPHLRDEKLIAFYESHIAKLEKMLTNDHAVLAS